jgi:drug/metabolite transporter (DMT)-like permease
LARLELLAAALLFSTGGVAIKTATLDAWQVAGLRGLVAATALVLLVPAARRGWSWRTALVGVPYAATFLLYTLANKNTTAANAIFLQDTAPLYVLLLSPWLLGERAGRGDLLFLGALAAGAALLFAGTSEPAVTAPAPRLGNVLALASGLAWALCLLGLRWLSVRSAMSGDEPLAAVVTGCLLAFAVAAAVLAPDTPYPAAEWSARNWAILGYLGVVQIGLAYIFVTRAMRRVAALEASLLLLAEPVFTPIWAWWLLGEQPSPVALAGGAIIVAATAVDAVARGVSSAHVPPKTDHP